MNLDKMNSAVLRTFGQPVIIVVGAAETETTGIFSAPYTTPSQQRGYMQVERPDPMVAVPCSAWQASSGTPGDAVLTGGETWVVVSVKQNGGLCELTLRAFS